MIKCNSCLRSLDGHNGNGYNPCGCVVYVKPMSEAELAEAKVKFRKAMDQDLQDSLLYSKRIQIEPKPKYVEPPRPFIIPERNQKFQYTPPFYQRASFIFSLGLVIGILLGKVL